MIRDLNRLACRHKRPCWNLYSPQQFQLNTGVYKGLGDPCTIGMGFHFAVKVDFEGEGSTIKNRPAVLALAEVALYFAGDFRGQASLEVFAD